MAEREIESMVTPVDEFRNKRGTGCGKICVKSGLRVEEIERPKIGRAGRASGSKNCMHTKRNRGSSRSGRRNTGGTEDKLLELFSGEQRITGRGIVGEEAGAGLGAEGGEGGGVKAVNVE
jgi:hypothetical protein